MEHIYTIMIPGQPVPASRPRVTRGGTFTPKRYAQWKAGASMMMRNAKDCQALDCPLFVVITAVWPRPKSRPGQVSPDDWKAGRRIRRDRTPDVDNIVKACLDAGNDAGLWVDDARVWRCDARQYYAAKGELPRVVVEVWQTAVVEGDDD